MTWPRVVMIIGGAALTGFGTAVALLAAFDHADNGRARAAHARTKR